MTATLRLAWRFVAFHRIRTMVLVGCLSVTMSLPLSMRILVAEFRQQLTSRAGSTPLVIGATGSRFDLALHALYFRGQPPADTSMSEVDRINESSYATAIPMLARYRAEGFSVIGTTTDYFELRRLSLADGQGYRRHGDCLLGSTVAKQLNLRPGDTLLSTPELAFAIDGAFPLKMRIVGILAESNTCDDEAVFVEIHTAWIIAGIGHGHASSQHSQTDGVPNKPVHEPGLTEYTEITDNNASSFHFHGSPDQFPLTAIIAVPNDERGETLLLGRYLDPEQTTQAIRPVEVVEELLQFVFRLGQFFDLVFAALAVIALLFASLVVTLSLRLRQREFVTMNRIGASRGLIVRLVTTELLIVLTISLALSGLLQVCIDSVAPQLVSTWLAS